LGDAHKCPKQKVGWLVVEARECDQSAQIGEVMNSETLLVAVCVRRHDSPSENWLERGSNF
jgi:hypothetical protein